MRAILVSLLAVALGGALSAPAATGGCPQMDLALGKTNIEMGMTYCGDTVLVSATAPEGSRIAVMLVSAHNPPLRVTRKGKVGLFWMGVKQLEACNMPYLYRLYSSAPLAEIASPQAVKELCLGYDALRGQLVCRLVKGEPGGDDAQVLFDGFIKLKENMGLYGVDEDAIRFGPEGRFEQAVFVPDKAPEGEYVIHAYAFKDGQLVAAGTRQIKMSKVGLGAWLTETARDEGLFYGLMAVVVALSAGLGVGLIFKKGGAH